MLQVLNNVTDGRDGNIFEIELVAELPGERLGESAVHGPVGEYLAPMLGECLCFLGRRSCARAVGKHDGVYDSFPVIRHP